MKESIDFNDLYSIVSSFKGDFFAKEFIGKMKIFDPLYADFSQHIYEAALAIKNISDINCGLAFDESNEFPKLHQYSNEFMKHYGFILDYVKNMPESDQKLCSQLIENLILTE